MLITQDESSKKAIFNCSILLSIVGWFLKQSKAEMAGSNKILSPKSCSYPILGGYHTNYHKKMRRCIIEKELTKLQYLVHMKIIYTL